MFTIVSQSPAVASARALSRSETEQSLTPWLGSGLDLSELPIPRLVVARLATRDADALAALRAKIEQAAPEAVFDDHAIWLSHLSAVGAR